MSREIVGRDRADDNIIPISPMENAVAIVQSAVQSGDEIEMSDDKRVFLYLLPSLAKFWPAGPDILIADLVLLVDWGEHHWGFSGNLGD